MSFDKVDAETAFKRTASSAISKWPSRARPDRLADICLPAIDANFCLVPGEQIFTIGSCFARHIEAALRDQGFRVPARDFSVPADELRGQTTMRAGILNKYTPMSMLNEVKFAAGSTDGREFLLETSEGLYLDGQLHTDVPVPLERALERREELRTLYSRSLTTSRVVIVTLGLVEAWWDEKEQVYLNDTVPKAVVNRHPGRFSFEILSPDKVIAGVADLLESMRAFNPEQRVLLTVSPVPFARTFSGRDAIIANSYSKSVLRVAAEVARARCSWVEYYPSFESVTHSDRNIAWEDDLIHVRTEVVAANVRRMLQAYAPRDDAGLRVEEEAVQA